MTSYKDKIPLITKKLNDIQPKYRIIFLTILFIIGNALLIMSYLFFDDTSIKGEKIPKQEIKQLLLIDSLNNQQWGN